MDFFQEFRKAAEDEYGVGGEEQRQAQYRARAAADLGPDAPKMEGMLGAYRLPQVIKKAIMGDKKLPQVAPQFLKELIEVQPNYEKGRQQAGVPIVMDNSGQKAGRLVGAVANDLTQDATRRFWWLLNAAQAVGEIGAEQSLKIANPDLYSQTKVLEQKVNTEGRPVSQMNKDNIKTPLMVEKERRKYKPGLVQALAIPSGFAINTGLGLMTPVSGAEGYKAALPSEEDPTKTSNVLGEVALKYFMGRTGNLLPYDEFVKVRPDVSKEEYGRYKAYKHSKQEDWNPLDDGQTSMLAGALRTTSEGIHGPELQFLGRSLPVTTGLIPYLSAVAGGVAGVMPSLGAATGDAIQTPNPIMRQLGSDKPIRRGFFGGLAGLAAGYGGGRIIEEIRRRRNAAENELDGTLS